MAFTVKVDGSTVDGSEILRSPVEVGRFIGLSNYLRPVFYIPTG